MNPISVGIAGLGRSGWNLHAKALARLPEQYKIAAVMDLSEERRAEAYESFGCQTFRRLDALLNSDIDLVVLATPSHLHSEHTLKALQAGKHVMVEKPLAKSVAEVDKMIAASKEAGKVLTVNQNYRYHHDIRTLNEVIASGKLGELVQIRVAIHQFSRRWDWQTVRERNGGILTNHGAHAIDWLLLHFEDEDPDVFCHLVNTPLYAGDADSHAKVIIRPKDGPLIDIELTHCNAFPQDSYLIMGTTGSLKGNKQSITWRYFNPDKEQALKLNMEPTIDRSYNRESLCFTEEVVELNTSFGEAMVQLYTDLYNTLRNGAALTITPESVRRQIAIFEKCWDAAGWTLR